MTDATVALRWVLETCSEADFLREMISFAADRLVALEVGGLTGAGAGCVEALLPKTLEPALNEG